MFDAAKGVDDTRLLIGVRLWSSLITEVLFSRGFSTTRNLVRRATKNMCLHAEWFLMKNSHEQLLTVPMRCCCPNVTLMQYDFL